MHTFQKASSGLLGIRAGLNTLSLPVCTNLVFNLVIIYGFVVCNSFLQLAFQASSWKFACKKHRAPALVLLLRGRLTGYQGWQFGVRVIVHSGTLDDCSAEKICLACI
jgi:hypothetical protein